MEQFSGVEVHGSVLNLTIGQNMSCELHEVIAENEDLSFQVCLGSPENCLKSIDLGSVPYAVKANFAKVAQNAHRSSQAAVSHYAHRITADKQLWLTKTLGTGYFDFHTDPNKGEPWMAPGWEDGGFLLWTPTRNPVGGRTLRVAARDHAQDALADLDLLVFRSDETQMSGALGVALDLEVGGNASIEGGLYVVDDVTVAAGGIDVAGDALVGGHGQVALGMTVGGALTAGGDITSQEGGIEVAGAGAIGGDLGVTGAVTAGGKLTVASGGAEIQAGGLEVTGDAAVDGAMDVTGPATFTGVVTFEGGTVDTGAQAQMDELYVWTSGEIRDLDFGGLMSFLGGAVFDGVAQFLGLLKAEAGLEVSGGATVAGGLDVTGTTTLQDGATFNGNATLASGAALRGAGNGFGEAGQISFWDGNDEGMELSAASADGWISLDAGDGIYVRNNPGTIFFNDDGAFTDEAQAGLIRFAEYDENVPGQTRLELGIWGDDTNDHMWFHAPGGHYFDGAARFRDGISNDQDNLTLDDDVIVNGNLFIYHLYSRDDTYIDVMDDVVFYDTAKFKEAVTFDKDVTGLTATLGDCDTASTACQDEGWGHGIEYLDKHGVSCGPNKVLFAVDFQNCVGGIKVSRTCCSIIVK